jgi:RNA polymerase sigma-70 factor, ECF subfamily
LSLKQQQFESLVRSFYEPLYRFALWKTHSRNVAEDLVQETFTRAWKNLHQLQDLKSAKAWLFTIINRENARRFERKQLPMVELSDVWQLESISDGRDDIETLLIRQAILKLPEIYSTPLALQIIGGLSTDEIAQCLTLNQNTVSTRLFRARTELKLLLQNSQRSRGNNNG